MLNHERSEYITVSPFILKNVDMDITLMLYPCPIFLCNFVAVINQIHYVL